MNFGDAASPKNPGERLIKSKSIVKTYNLKIKSNTPYPILLIEVGLSPIESLAMTRLMLYKHKINNMGDHRLPKLAFNSSQNHLGSSEVGIKIPGLG